MHLASALGKAEKRNAGNLVALALERASTANTLRLAGLKGLGVRVEKTTVVASATIHLISIWNPGRL